MKWYISLAHQFENIELTYQAPVVQRAHNAFYWISDYPVTIVVCLSDLFAGWCCPFFKKVNSAQAKRSTAVAYSGLCSIKQLRVFLLPPGWDASPLQGNPQH